MDIDEGRDQQTVQRQNGVALWRQIADRIRTSIANGEYDDAGKVPAEFVLAAQFGVNRHTVRSALQALAQEGIVRSVQGRGTLIMRKERINFPISKRTRFSQGLGDQAREKQSVLLRSAIEEASNEIAARLKIAVGASVVRMETLGKADKRPVSRATSWFPADRFGNIADLYQKTGSITAAYGEQGLTDYIRESTQVTAVHAENADLADLELSPGAIVLVARALNADMDGTPIQYSITRFPADIVQLTIET
jgi:GntR family phosphonate transport system transcriptional regulator